MQRDLADAGYLDVARTEGFGPVDVVLLVAAIAQLPYIMAAGASALSVSRIVSSARIEPLLPMLILVWIAGVSMLSLRLLTGWIWVQRLRTRGP